MRFFIQSGALLGLVGVGLGAFGAHALRAALTAAGRLDTFETAVKYQFYHALALLAVGILLHVFAGQADAVRWLTYAGWSFLVGILVFSGSLYVLCATGITVLGAITPIGGVLMIAGWAMLFWAIRQM
jgi:uncharacterized membrane protein YgdD (TMEM256/DUF423 family)